MESKKSFYKSYQANWPKGGYGIKIQNYALIWSQMLISSQYKNKRKVCIINIAQNFGPRILKT